MVINFVRIPRYYLANLSIGRSRQNWGRRGERAKEKRTSSSPSTSPLKSQISSVVTPKEGLITQTRLNPKLAATTMEGKREETQLYSRHTEVRNLDFLRECPNYFASVCSPYASVHRPLSTNPPLKWGECRWPCDYPVLVQNSVEFTHWVPDVSLCIRSMLPCQTPL